jgi:putative hemolysin
MVQIETKSTTKSNLTERLDGQDQVLKSINLVYERLIKEQSIQFSYNQVDLRNLPKNSAFILVANHPLEGFDGLLILKTIYEQRPDIKILHDIDLPRYTQNLDSLFIGRSSYFLKK